MTFFISVPDKPKIILPEDKTTRSISIIITHGDGGIGFFDILVNGIYHSSVPLTKMNQYFTRANVTGLVPGTSYDDISVLTVTNGINSTGTTMGKYATCKYFI